VKRNVNVREGLDIDEGSESLLVGLVAKTARELSFVC